MEGIYTKVILDTRAQVTLLYRDLYDNMYDIPIKITFGPHLAGKVDS